MRLDSLFSSGQQQEEQGIGFLGVAVALVVDNRDPESLGRVKVSFPGRSLPDHSYWARIATLMAGAGRGSYFLPEVGDEVLVAFDHGDFHFPYIIGALWNGRDMPPADNRNGFNHIRKITSRSGHELIFDDDPLRGGVELHTSSGHKVVMNESIGQESIEISDMKGRNKIVMDTVQGKITITSSMSLKLKAKQIELEAAANMKLRAGAVLDISAALVTIN